MPQPSILSLAVALSCGIAAATPVAASPLLIAGGGGGSAFGTYPGGPGQTGPNGQAGSGTNGGAGGSSGSGGAGGLSSYGGGGGGGYTGGGGNGNGSATTSGQGGGASPAFAGGAASSESGSASKGGFGGGGGGGNDSGGGGGGYSGGGGGGGGTGISGGGGGSYIDSSLTAISAQRGANGRADSDGVTGLDGYVKLTLLGNGATFTFNYTGSDQIYTVATAGTYDIMAAGAQGGGGINGAIGGYGALLDAQFSFAAGTVLDFVVGGAGTGGFENSSGGGGGGGTFVLGSVAPPAPVPEPASLALLSLGAAGIITARNRRATRTA